MSQYYPPYRSSRNNIKVELDLANYTTKTDLNFKKKNFMAPFLWMGFNCLKARATSRRQFTFYH